jgi:hypothetical protein
MPYMQIRLSRNKEYDDNSQDFPRCSLAAHFRRMAAHAIIVVLKCSLLLRRRYATTCRNENYLQLEWRCDTVRLVKNHCQLHRAAIARTA